MEPMLATRGPVLPGGKAAVPAGDEWAHEVKWDGMRLLLEIGSGRVRALSRGGNDVTAAFPELAGLAALGPGMIVDGEAVAMVDGRPSFGALAERIHVREARKAERLAAAAPVTFVAFDLLRYDDQDVLDESWTRRRALLESLDIDPATAILSSVHADGESLLEAVRAQGLEGIISKRRDSRYRPGVRSRDWLKFPIRPNGSFVVGGYRHETGTDRRIGALLVGEPGPAGLVFRGRVGSGVAGRAGTRLLEMLAPLQRASSPFAGELPRADVEGTFWVEPVLVVDVEYLMLTRDGRLRQPAYRGVRADLGPADLTPARES
jgi:bifunctional non-homologous end joining protein LigD